MKLKTKYEKHFNDNEKRRKALSDKIKVKSSRAEIVKRALSTSSLHDGKSRKLFFDSDDEKSNVEKSEGQRNKSVLFDESNSEDETFEIKEKVQFGGKKGFELLKLQSTYGNDERFKIDERFLDEENFEVRENKNNVNLIDQNEKAKQFEIPDNILGESTVKGKKSKKRTYEMIRYDASNKDHEKYEIKQIKSDNEMLKKEKKRKKTKSESVSPEKKPKTVVSKEKFYKVSDNMKSALKEKKDESGGFSLLQTYGQIKADESERERDENEVVDAKSEILMDNLADSCEETVVEIESVERKEVIPSEKADSQLKAAVAKGIWKESFFFANDDPRFQEGLSFMNKKNSDEARVTAEKFDVNRKILREILRLRNKKQLSKKNPFKIKVGGMNKKQLAKRNFGKKREIFHRRKLPRMNPGGKL